MVLDKGQSGLGGFHRLGFMDFHQFRGLGTARDLHVLVHHDSRAEVHRQAHNDAQTYLANNLELAFQTTLVVVEHLDVVIGKTQCGAP